MLNLVDFPVNYKDNSFNGSIKKRIKLLKELVNKLEFPQKEDFFEELEDI